MSDTRGRKTFFEHRGDAATQEHNQDMVVLTNHCNDIYEDFGHQGVKVELGRLYGIFARMQELLHLNVGISNPSLFKRAAAFTIAFMEKSPLDLPLAVKGKKGSFGNLVKIKNYQNAMASFEYCRRCLHGAVIHKKTPTKIERLKLPIKVSKHFYYDTIHAIAQVPQKKNGLANGPIPAKQGDISFHLIALLYESLCYKANPKASYPERV